MKKLLICLVAAATLLPLSAKTPKGENSRDLKTKIEEGGGLLNDPMPQNGSESNGSSTGTDANNPAVQSAPAAPAYNAANDIARLVENACKDGAFIICQPFDGVDSTGEHYGAGDSDAVGQTYSVGYFIDGGYLFTQEALKPWLFDTTELDKAQAEGLDLTGSLLGKTQMAEQSQNPTYEVIAFDADNCGLVYPGKLYSMEEDSDNFLDGFYPFREKGELDGYVVWYMLNTPDQDLGKDTRLQVRAVPRKIKLTDKLEETYPIESYAKNNVGAIYVVPYSPGIGRYYFYLYGVGTKTADGKWELVFPFDDPNKVFDRQQSIKVAETEETPEEPKVENPSSHFKRKFVKKEPEAVAPQTPAASQSDEPVPEPEIPSEPKSSDGVTGDGEDSSTPLQDELETAD